MLKKEQKVYAPVMDLVHWSEWTFDRKRI